MAYGVFTYVFVNRDPRQICAFPVTQSICIWQSLLTNPFFNLRVLYVLVWSGGSIEVYILCRNI